jgi:hypothetical protein
MKIITVYGHSDDCIEVDGDLAEEFNTYNEWKYLHFNEGTVVKIGYSMKDAPKHEGKDKGWHVEVVTLGDGTKAEMLAPTIEDGDNHYTDKLQLVGDLKSVRCTKSAGGMTSEDLKEFFEDFDSGDYGDAQLLAAYKALQS